MKVDSDVAAKMIRESIVPCVAFVELTVEEIIAAQSNARKKGVRGGGVYDYMHLVAARKAKAEMLYTLNLDDFRSIRREDDPEVRRP
jgi:predicted nucleic acid-binding protein